MISAPRGNAGSSIARNMSPNITTMSNSRSTASDANAAGKDTAGVERESA